MSFNPNDHLLVSLENVSVVTSGGITLLKDISFSIYQEKILTIIGPNGAGKTTLLKALLGLVPLSNGTIQRSRGVKIGYLPQKLSVDYTLPVTVQHFLRIENHSLENLHTEPLFQAIAIEPLLNRFLYDLSGGELQRVLLVKALLNKPSLLVLDEPTQGMDQQGQSQLYAMVDKVRQLYRCAVVLVSHDLHFVFDKSHQVICINKHMCCMGHPSEVKNNPAYQHLLGNASSLSPYYHTHDHHHGLCSSQHSTLQ